MSNNIVIDDGLKSYTIVNKEGKEYGTFTFNPSDTNIVKRYEDVIEYINKISELFGDSEDIEALNEAQEAIKQKIDELFNADVSGSFFSISGPLTPLESGEFFIANVINAIGLILEKEMDVRLQKARTRINKYTGKYTK